MKGIPPYNPGFVIGTVTFLRIASSKSSISDKVNVRFFAT